MSWYRTGTASFTNGSTAVTGSGTLWNSNVAAGEALLGPDGNVYEIASVGSDTAITLGSAYLSATAGAQAYVIAPTQAYLRDLAAQAAALVNSYSSIAGGVFTAVKAGDGSAATPGLTFNADQDTGLFRPGANTVAVATAGSERMRVDANGNVGIGGAPTNRVDVFHGVNGIGARVRNSNTNVELAIRTDVTTSGLDAGNATAMTFSHNTVELMRLDSSGNLKVGSGVASPGAKVMINTPNGSAATLQLFQDTLESWQIGLPSNSTALTFANSGTERLRITNSGNVGIGTSAPMSLLDVRGAVRSGLQTSAINGTVLLRDSYSSGESLATINTARGTGGILMASGVMQAENAVGLLSTTGVAIARTALLLESGNFIFSSATAATVAAGSAVSLTEVARVDVNGKMGIGTASPTSKLTVLDADAVTAVRLRATTGMLRITPYLDATAGCEMSTANAAESANTPLTLVASALRVAIGGTLATTVDANGNLSAGTATAQARVTSATASTSGCFASNNTLGSGTRYHLTCYESGVERGSITSNGSTTSYNTSSDYRLKANPQPLTGSGEFIDSLQPKTWQWVADDSPGTGFIAHEVALVSPGSVIGEKDATRDEVYEIEPVVPAVLDEEGNEVEPAVPAVMGTRTVPRYQAMEYGSAEFIANIVAELQSLRLRVAALEAL